MTNNMNQTQGNLHSVIDSETLSLIAELDAEFGKKEKYPTSGRHQSVSFPPYEDIEGPLLCFILFHGVPEYEVRASDTYRPLADFFGLSESERHELLYDDTGRQKWSNMVQWARRKLKDRGYLDLTAHGVWRLSDAGLMEAQRIRHRYGQLK